MKASKTKNSNRPHWFVCSKDPNRLNRFINEGIWKYYDDEVEINTRYIYRGYLREVVIGDRIAIFELGAETQNEFKKSHNVEITGKFIKFLTIKAIGKIIKPSNECSIVGVNWKKAKDSRRWYHYTYGGQIWRVFPENKQGWGGNLIEFTFDGLEQDLQRLYFELQCKT